MTRIVPVTVLVVVVLAASGVVSAQTTGGGGSLPNGASINIDKLYIHEDGSKDAVLPKIDPDSLWKYFNLAHCQCAKAQPGFVESKFEYLLTSSGSTSPIDEPLNIWVGASCNTDQTTRNTMCTDLAKIQPPVISPKILQIQATNDVHVVIPIYNAMNPEPVPAGTPPADCRPRVLTATIWGLADSTIGSGLLDYSVSKSITTDSAPPPLPTSFRASGGDGAIELSWTSSDTSDVFAYQALCARADDDSPGRTSGLPPQRYMTAATLCSDDSMLPLMALNVPPPAGGGTPDPVSMADLPADLANLNPMFLCGENTTATATSLRIGGLENGVAYKVVLLVVDKFQNPTGAFFTSTITPVPSTDFWEDLHDRGSKTEGGLCLLAETYGDGSPLTSALRAFRDDTLGGSRAGRWLADAYYATAGRLGVVVHGSVTLRIAAGVALAPVVAFALLWHWLTLPGLLGLLGVAWLLARRRHAAGHRIPWLLRLRAARVATAIAVIALGAGRASAGGFQPYWEDSAMKGDENQSLADEPGLVEWHVGIRLGPYVPDVDSQVAGPAPGPYAQMFTGTHYLPMLDVDRILWSGFGQVGVGLSFGYWQKTARAFTAESNPGDSMRARASDVNKFRLIPTELSALYRFTWLDDQYGIPVVPYVRGGLAYYVWWISTPSGYARVCSDGGMQPTCSQDKALGASLGVTGAIGIAIRGERIDPSAALSMRQSGLQHAGLYGELSIAKVDGFGSDTKLSVGDRTWFAGVDFEF